MTSLEKKNHVTSSGAISICCLGKTGVGKSTILNRILGDTSLKGNEIEGGFVAKNSVQSVTKGVNSKEATFDFKEKELEAFNGILYKIFDTPGLNDSEGGDKVLVNAVTDFFKKTCDGINVFLLCFQVTSPRFCSNTKGMLVILEQLFGKEFWKHVIVVFTRYDFDRHGECEDQEDYDQTATDYVRQIQDTYSLDFSLPVATVGKRNYIAGVKKIINFAFQIGKFSCRYMKGWDQLKKYNVNNPNEKKEHDQIVKQLLEKVQSLEDKVSKQVNSNQGGGFRLFRAIGNVIDAPINWVGEKVSNNCTIM